MTGDPAKISHATISVVGVDVEDILDCHSCTEKVSTDGVHDTLGLAGGARRLLNTSENDEETIGND